MSFPSSISSTASLVLDLAELREKSRSVCSILIFLSMRFLETLALRQLSKPLIRLPLLKPCLLNLWCSRGRMSRGRRFGAQCRQFLAQAAAQCFLCSYNNGSSGIDKFENKRGVGLSCPSKPITHRLIKMPISRYLTGFNVNVDLEVYYFDSQLFTSMEPQLLDFCQVCNFYFTDNPLPYKQKIECRKCRKPTHRSCYFPCLKKDSFLCDPCYHPSSPSKIICYICNNEGGLMKRSKDGKYGHVICFLYSNEFVVCSYSKLKFISFRTNEKKTVEKCSVCFKKTTGLIKCQKEGCQKKVHVNCIFKGFKYFGNKGNWKQEIHRMNRTGAFFLKFRKYIEAKFSSTSKKIWPKSSTERIQPLLQVFCPEHEIRQKCYCENTELSKWIQCDFCGVWSHQKCEQSFGGIELYECSLCRKWKKALMDGFIPLFQTYPQLQLYDCIYVHYILENNDYRLDDREVTIMNRFPLHPSITYCSYFLQNYIWPILKNKFPQHTLDELEASSNGWKPAVYYTEVVALLRILVTDNFNFPYLENDWSHQELKALISKFNCKYMTVINLEVPSSETDFVISEGIFNPVLPSQEKMEEKNQSQLKVNQEEIRIQELYLQLNSLKNEKERKSKKQELLQLYQQSSKTVKRKCFQLIKSLEDIHYYQEKRNIDDLVQNLILYYQHQSALPSETVSVLSGIPKANQLNHNNTSQLISYLENLEINCSNTTNLYRFFQEIKQYQIEPFGQMFRALNKLAKRLVRINSHESLKSKEQYEVYKYIWTTFDISSEWLHEAMRNNEILDNFLSKIELKNIGCSEESVCKARKQLNHAFMFAHQHNLGQRIAELTTYQQWYKLYDRIVQAIPTFYFHHKKSIQMKKIKFMELNSILKQMNKHSFPQNHIRSTIEDLQLKGKEELKTRDLFIATFQANMSKPQNLSSSTRLSRDDVLCYVKKLQSSMFDFGQIFEELTEILKNFGELEGMAWKAIQSNNKKEFSSILSMMEPIPIDIQYLQNKMKEE